MTPSSASMDTGCLRVFCDSARPDGFPPRIGPMDGATDDQTLYDLVGGHTTFAALISAFFDEVRADPVVAPIYPADDWEGAEKRLLLFYEQLWGGPPSYSESRGAPLLKMRHMAYSISPCVSEAWISCMSRAVDRINLPESAAEELRDYAVRAARYLINADEPHTGNTT